MQVMTQFNKPHSVKLLTW